MSLSAALILLLAAPPALAHTPFAADLLPWDRVPLLIGAVAMATGWLRYCRGARRVAPRPGAAACFHAGMVVAAFSAFGPLDDWAETDAAWHMVQHMAFMVVVAPLWAFAAPLPQWRAAGAELLRPLWRHLARVAAHPRAAALLHGVTIWLWHMPALYVLALESPWWHAVEHVAFLFTAWLFWWAVLRASPRDLGAALLAVGVTLMHTGLLGALLTFATQSFYGAGRSVEAQQLAGLIMWVPGSLFYLAAGGWLVWRRFARTAEATAAVSPQAGEGR